MEIPCFAADGKVVGCFIHRDDSKVFMNASEDAFGCMGERCLQMLVRGVGQVLFASCEDGFSPLVEFLLVNEGFRVVPGEASDALGDVLREA